MLRAAARMRMRPPSEQGHCWLFFSEGMCAAAGVPATPDGQACLSRLGLVLFVEPVQYVPRVAYSFDRMFWNAFFVMSCC